MKTNIILIGSSSLLFKCARLVNDFYGDNADLTIIDTAFSPLKRNDDSPLKVLKLSSKAEIFSFFDTISTPTYLLSINNPFIIPSKYTDNPLFTMINLHHALLPNHPGRNAEAWAIFDEDEFAGITWHYISSGIDSGDIIKQCPVKINSNMTSLNLLKECEKEALSSLPYLLPLENLASIKSFSQPHHNTAPKKASEKPNDGFLILDNSWSIEKKHAFLRSFDYGILQVLGTAKCVWNNQTYLIQKYKFFEEPSVDNEIEFFQENNKSTLIIKENNKKLVLNLKEEE